MDQREPWHKQPRFLIPIGIVVITAAAFLAYQYRSSNNQDVRQIVNSTGNQSQKTIPIEQSAESTESDYIYERPSNFLNSLPITQSATCYFGTVSSTTFENKDDPFADIDARRIIFNTEEQSKPTVVAFVDLDTPTPKLTANMGQAELVKIVDTSEIVTLIEKAPIVTGDNVIVYTIHKNEGVATWTKQYKLITTPYALVSMGYCE